MDNVYNSLTVYKRLTASGLIENFNKAIKEKNIDEAKLLLIKIGIINEDYEINPILKNFGLLDNIYGAMTVNERLWVSGLWYSFKEAIKEKNVEKVIKILYEVEIFDEANIKGILKNNNLIKYK